MLKSLLAGAALAAAAPSPLLAQDNPPDPGRAALDRLAIVEAIDAVGFYADQRDWDRVAAQFHPDGAVIDYTSYAQAIAGAAQPELLPPAEIVARWRTVLPGYDHTQHLIGNHLVEVAGDEATARSVVHATHVLVEGGTTERWIFLGDYEHHLVRTPDGWKIDRMIAHLRAELGNPELPRRARARLEQASASQP